LLFAQERSADAEKEIRQLRGVWNEPPPKGKGRSGYNTLVIDGERLLWVITHTLDGEPLSRVSLPYVYRLDLKAEPKAITIKRWDLKRLAAKQGIYELKGNTLRLCIGTGDNRPRRFDAEHGKLLFLARDTGAKVPELAFDKADGEAKPILPAKQWAGRIRERGLEAQAPAGPITTQLAFEKLWRAWRGTEEVPEIDFTKQFVVARTSPHTLTEIGLLTKDSGVTNWAAATAEEGKVSPGFSYIIGVFRREKVDVIDGKLIPKK
jgi:uncharacterized protein (TIGR03067 family)